MSRIVGMLVAFACSFAAGQVEAAAPHVKKAVDQLDDALRSDDPIGAFVDVLWEAWNGWRNDEGAGAVSLTGLLGAVARSAQAGFSKD